MVYAHNVINSPSSLTRERACINGNAKSAKLNKLSGNDDADHVEKTVSRTVSEQRAG